MQQAPSNLSPLAILIYHEIKAAEQLPIKWKERDIYSNYYKRGFKRVTIHLALCELYQKGHVNRVTFN